MDILNIRRLAVIEKGPLLVEDQGQGGDQVRAKTDRPDKAILNPHRARAALLRQVDHVPRRFATPPCKIIPRSRLPPGTGLRIPDAHQPLSVLSRSQDLRVGSEFVSTFRSRSVSDHVKKTKK